MRLLFIAVLITIIITHSISYILGKHFPEQFKKLPQQNMSCLAEFAESLYNRAVRARTCPGR